MLRVFNGIRGLACAVALVLTTWPALAQSPVGQWKLDEAAYREQWGRVMESLLAAVPAEQREMMRQIMTEQGGDVMEGAMASRVEFRADGTMIATDAEGSEHAGTWVAEGDGLRISSGEPDAPAMLGTFDGDTLVLRFDPSDPLMQGEMTAWAKDFTMILLPE